MAFRKDRAGLAVLAAAWKKRPSAAPAGDTSVSPALRARVQDEQARWTALFGDDDRARTYASVFEVTTAAHTPYGDREEEIEADWIAEKIESNDIGSLPRVYQSWAQGLLPSPKPGPTDHALAAVEMFVAFLFTNGRRKQPRAGSSTAELTQKLQRIMRGQRASFARAPSDIIDDWVAKEIALHPSYRPSGRPRAAIAYLTERFRLRLDDEPRRVGSTEVLPGWVRAQKRAGRIVSSMPLTEADVDAVRARNSSAMKHAPPAGYVNKTQLRDELVERQDETAVLHAVLKARRSGTVPLVLRSRLVEAHRAVDHLQRIDDEDLKGVAARNPAWIVESTVKLAPRTVDLLVAAYELQRGDPFARLGRSVLIPVGEIDKIAAFANARAT